MAMRREMVVGAEYYACLLTLAVRQLVNHKNTASLHMLPINMEA